MYEQIDIFTYLCELEKQRKKEKVKTPRVRERRKKPTTLSIPKLIRKKKGVLRDFGISSDIINDAFDDKDIITTAQIDIIGNELIRKYFTVLDVKDAANSIRV